MDLNAWRQWALYWLWLAGYWTAMVVLITFTLWLVWPRSFLWSKGLPFVLAVLIATFLIHRRYQASLFCCSRRTGSAFETRRVADS
jgi:hypothetical protein